MDGQYSEKLPSGGELIVTSSEWKIRYYFPGPDLRYNGEFVTISGREIERYIVAWKRNFEKYLQLKENVPSGGNYTATGEMGMTIWIGRNEGVCLKSYHMAIRTRRQLDQVIHDYEFVQKRAEILQRLLKTI